MPSTRAIAVASGAVTVTAIAIGLAVRPRAPQPMPPEVVIAVPAGEPRILVAHRSMLGERAELELVRARDGGLVWKTPMPNLGPDARAIVASEGAIVVLLNDDGSRPTIVAIDPETGAVRWRAPFAGSAYRTWIHAGVVVIQPLSTSETPLHGLDQKTGRELWRSEPVSSQYAPVFAGERLLVPTRHASFPPLRIVHLPTGASRSVGRGLAWPGIPEKDGYLTVFAPELGDEPLVSFAALHDPSALLDAGNAAPAIDGGATAGIALARLSVESGEARRVFDAAGEVAEPRFLATWGDRVVFDRGKKSTALVSRTKTGGDERALPAPTGYRFWSGGAADTVWLSRESWPYLAARTRFVPMILNHEESDAAKLCVLDLEALAFTWCAERDIPPEGTSPWGWMHATTRGDLHFVVVQGALVVLDGSTGGTRGVVALRGEHGAPAPAWPVRMETWARAGDVLAVAGDGLAWAIDLRTLSLAWTRGPIAVAIRDARAEVEAVLGPLPRSVADARK